MDTINTNKITEDLITLLFQLNEKVINHEEVIKCAPLPPSHVKVIFYLQKFGSAPISQIAQNLGISKSNMTPIIDKLLSEELVHRKEDPKDRRVLRIELTEKAFNLFEEVKKKMIERLFKKVSCLSDEDLNILDNSMKDIKKVIAKFE